MTRTEMLVVILCCMMKLVEMTSGTKHNRSRKKPYWRRHQRPWRGVPVGGGVKGGDMMTDVMCGGGVPCSPRSPDSDCNSNHTTSTDHCATSCVSNASQDMDFIQDNSDYQWFLDYGYRESGVHQHTSVLSSLSASYAGVDEIGYYDVLSKNLDANLAEADMESFRTEDIHSLLTTLPTMCTDMQMPQEMNRQGEMFASVTGSMMAKFDFDSSISPHSSSQGEDSTGSVDTMSICKSELLFSPVKEVPMPGANYSVDSLDCELLNEHDIMLTCQANKDNYTIAFEGSVTMYSEDSDYHDTDKSETTNSTSNHWVQELKTSQKKKLLNKALESSMAKSDSGFTTWSKLKKRSSETILRRHPSGNNNTTNDDSGSHYRLSSSATLKSQSMPNLNKHKMRYLTNLTQSRLNNAMSNSSMESYSHLRCPVGCIKVFDIQHNAMSRSMLSDMASSLDGGNSSSSERQLKANPPNFNLVKRFMKQKSISAEGMSTVLNRSSASECFRSGDSSDSFDGKSHSLNKLSTSINETCDNKNNRTLNHHQHSWVPADEVAAEYSAYVFEDSLVEPRTIDIIQRTHDLIEEETEDGVSERSESVEQISESISKIDSTCGDLCNSCRSDKIHSTVERKHNPRSLFNVNNNNSIERSNSPYLEHQQIRMRKINGEGPFISSAESASISMCSSSEGTDTTKIQKALTPTLLSKNISTQLPIHLIDRSIQTSLLTEINVLESPSKLSECPKGIEPIKIIEQSFLSKLKDGEMQKSVYVLYPNYTLPDLEFLKEKQEDISKILLVPQQFKSDTESVEINENKNIGKSSKSRRPFSCNDVEALKKKGFGHVRDWDSLTFLLPNEYRQILAEVPEVVQQIKNKEEDLMKQKERPLFCVSPPMKHRPRPISCDFSNLLDRTNITNVSSSSSTATQPSSGYRGSSTMLLTDSAQNSPAPTNNYNPLFIYRYDSVTSSETSLLANEKQRSQTGAPPLPKRSISLLTSDQKQSMLKKTDRTPPRPPLPKSILRKSLDNVKIRKSSAEKRYSMFEISNDDTEDQTRYNNYVKRKSLPDPYYLIRRKTEMTFDDEGVDAGTDSSVEEQFKQLEIRPPTPPLPKTDENVFIFPSINSVSQDELLQLEEFLKQSGISCSDSDEWDDNDILRLKSHVSKFLSLKINQNRRKIVTFSDKISVRSQDEDSITKHTAASNVTNIAGHRHFQTTALVDMPICEEGETSPEGHASPPLEKVPIRSHSVDLSQKRALISAVTESVERIIQHFSTAMDHSELSLLGDSTLSPTCAKLVLTTLCPSLYAVLCDGLKPNLETAFGAIGNSVWQVVEASAQQGPLTKSLNELVMRINGEDFITEGLVKFNAFVFGLLNVRSLDAWTGYLRTRESILRKHYNPDSLLVMAHTGGSTIRTLLDTLLASLQPLAMLPFQLDLLFEYRQLHLSLKRMDSFQQPTSPTHYKTTPSPTQLSSKQWKLMKIVRSIQSSISQSGESSDEITTAAAAVLRHLQQNHSADTIDPSLPDLLESSALTKTYCKDDKPRPRSCVDSTEMNQECALLNDVASTVKKRWSGIHLNSKLYQAFDRLVAEDTEEEYTDSLEHAVNRRLNDKQNVQLDLHNSNDQIPSEEDKTDSPVPSLQEDIPDMKENHTADDKNSLNSGKFRRLQLKWEMLSAKELISANSTSPPPIETESPVHTPSSTGSVKSRIPRLITSPVRAGAIPPPSQLPVKSNQLKKGTSSSQIPASQVKKTNSGSNKTISTKITNTRRSQLPTTNRTSRVDQQNFHDINQGTRPHPVRPSSLPYRPSPQASKTSKLTPPRRAVSSSLHRSQKSRSSQPSPKIVRTLSHRLPSDTGHLSFNEGEKLKVILEVDNKWLLCCRGDQKGLVPRSAVISLPDSGQKF